MAEILYELIDTNIPTGKVQLFEEGQEPQLPLKPDLVWLKQIRKVPGEEFHDAFHVAEEQSHVIDEQAGTITYELKARSKTDFEIDAAVDRDIGNVRTGEQEGVFIEVLIALINHINTEAGLSISADPAALYGLVTTATEKRANDIKGMKKGDPLRAVSA